jgi:Domain of unknown function (DUF3362)
MSVVSLKRAGDEVSSNCGVWSHHHTGAESGSEQDLQSFTSTPADIDTCMWYTGIDPCTKKLVPVARHLRDRKLQRALMEFFEPENYFQVREALVEAGRSDLIGNGCDCLVAAQPPKEPLQARRKRANSAPNADYYHAVPKPTKSVGEWGVSGAAGQKRGYRPHRKSQQRQRRHNDA